MFHPVTQAEMILSFQDEKRQQYQAMLAKTEGNRARRAGLMGRLLQFGGALLVRTGERLQQLADAPQLAREAA